jgi:hypothetical protein
MDLFIRVDQNGNAVDHPIMGDNFCAAFPDVDPDNLPAEFSKFVRVPCPAVGVYEILDSETPTYQKVDGVFQDVWVVRGMSDAEKVAKQQKVQGDFISRSQAENWSAWVFDAETCSMQPPTPRPPEDDAKFAAGIYTFWCGADNGWKDSPAYPRDGNVYEFDFIAWQWAVV